MITKKMSRTFHWLIAFVVILSFMLVCCPVNVFGESSAHVGMSMSQDGIDMIKKFEGFSKYPYWDYGQYTVGYGTRCPSEDVERYRKDGITEAEAEELLKVHIVQVETALNTFRARYGWNLNQYQFDALASFTYNCGVMWGYNSTGIRNAITNGVTGVDFIQELSRWCNAGGKVLPGLVSRRLCEGKLYTDGVYSNTKPSEYSYVYLDVGEGACDYKIYIFNNTQSVPFDVTAELTYAEFLGWFDKQDSGNQITELNSSIKSGSTIYAQFRPFEDSQVPIQPMPTDPSEEMDPGTTVPPEDTVPAEPTTPENEEKVIVSLTVTGDYVNIRESSSTSSRVCGHVVAGDKIDVFEIADVQGTYWGRIDRGWVCLTYTDYKNNNSEQTPTDKPDTSILTETVDLNGVIYNCDNLNVRCSPGVTNELIGRIKNGTLVHIAARALIGQTYWGKIEQGWISMDYVKLNSAESDEPVLYTGVVINCGALNVRIGAGTQNDKCDTLYPGAAVSIYETTTISEVEWGRCDKGWISLQYVDLTKVDDNTDETPSDPIVPETPAVPDESENETSPPVDEEIKSDDVVDNSSDESSDSLIVTVTQCNGLNVRESYGTNHKSVKIVRTNEKLIILDQKYFEDMIWGRCEFGWISMKYVDLDISNPLSGRVMAGNLRIRQNAGLSNSIVGYYKFNDIVSITDIQRVAETNWGKTDKGWISMDYIVIQ